MQQKRNGKQLMMIGGILIVLVLGVGFFFTHQGGSSKPAAASSTQPVVVASQTIAQGTVFQRGQSVSDLFKVEQEPSNLVPFGAYTDLSQITALTHTAGCGPVQSAGCEGQVTATQTIFQGTPVVSGMFSTLGQYRTGVDPAFAIPYGYVAIAIPLTLANSVQGSVSPGDDVDLIATYTDTSIKNPLRQTSTQYALNDLRVISVNGPPATSTSSSSSSNPLSSASSNTGANAVPGSGGNLVVLVRYQQALVVQHLKDDPHWTMSVVLRSAKETDIQHFKTLTVNGAWYFFKQQNPFQDNPGY